MVLSLIHAGQKLLDSLAETWDFFFCDVLSMLQAIFHPVQVHNLLNKLLVFFFFFFVHISSVESFSWVVLMAVSSSLCFLQGKEPSVRQLALLHFRNTIVLSVKLEDALSRPRARVPPSVTQMLLILQVSRTLSPTSTLVCSAIFVLNRSSTSFLCLYLQ